MNRFVLALALIFVSPQGALADQSLCRGLPFLAKMASSTTMSSLTQNRLKAGGSYQAELIYALKAFELSKEKKEATRLLADIPNGKTELEAWLALGDSICARETVLDMQKLADIKERSSSLASEAVALYPSGMRRLILFVMLATEDPHDQGLQELESVCQRDKWRFSRAVKDLPKGEQKWFVSHLFDIGSCRARVKPEADD